MILGIDEVGRGAWAGPLVVGAVVLGGAQITGLTDSKVLSKKRRIELDLQIRTEASAVGLGWVWPEEIDEIGLSASLRLATKRAVRSVQAQRVQFDEIIIDGTINFLSNTTLAEYVTTMKKADLLVPSASAASIVAKVARDQYMRELDAEVPGYSFSAHVGYGTKAHRDAIANLGASPVHRLSIAPLAKYRPRELAVVELAQRSVGIPNDTTRSIGDKSETAAAEELVRRGHEIIERNWKTKLCEIDIVSKKDSTYYFSEIKHRRSDRSGDGLAAITTKKLKQMEFAAAMFAHTMHIANENLRLAGISTSGEEPRVDEIVLI